MQRLRRVSLLILLVLYARPNALAQPCPLPGAPQQTYFDIEVSPDGSTFGAPSPSLTPWQTDFARVFGVKPRGITPSWWSAPGASTTPTYMIMFMWVQSNATAANVNFGDPERGTLAEAVAEAAVTETAIQLCVASGHDGLAIQIGKDQVVKVLQSISDATEIPHHGQLVNSNATAAGHTDWKSWAPAWNGSGSSPTIWLPTYVNAIGTFHLLGVGNMVQQATVTQETVALAGKNFLTQEDGLKQLFDPANNTTVTFQAIFISLPPQAPPEVSISEALPVTVANNPTINDPPPLLISPLWAGPVPPTMTPIFVMNVGLTVPAAMFVIYDVPDGIVACPLLASSIPGVVYCYEPHAGTPILLVTALSAVSLVLPPGMTPLGLIPF